MNGIFNRVTEWIYETPFYQEHMVNWPSPLNDASFDLFLLFLIVLVVVLPDLYDRIRTALAGKRIRKKKGEKEEENRVDAGCGITREELMEQYFRFLMFLKIRQLEMEVSFEQYREAKLQYAIEERDPGEETPGDLSEFESIIRRIRRTTEEKTRNAAYEKEQESRFQRNAVETDEKLRSILSAAEKKEAETVTFLDPALERAKQNALKAREKDEEKQRKLLEKERKRQEKRRTRHEKEEAEIPCD